MKNTCLFLLLAMFWVEARASEEVPQSLTLDGRLYVDASSKTPLLDTGTFKIQILDYNSTCVLYEEQQSFDTRGSDGAFNINVGEKASGTTKRTTGDSGNTLAAVFANNGGTVPGKALSNGAACTGPATSGSNRSIRITVIPSSDPTPRVMTPFVLNSVPSALVAERSESLQGLSSNAFLQVKSTAPYSLSQANVENVFSNVNYPKLVDLLNGASVSYVHSGANGTIQAPSISGTPSSPVAGQVWYDAGVIKYWDGASTQALSAGSGITSLTIGTGLTPTGTITTGGSTIAVDTGVTAGKIVQVQAGGKLPALDASDLTNVTASAFSSTGSISTSGSVSANAANFRSLTLTNAGTQTITLNPAASITGSPISFTLPAAMPASNGYVLSSTTAGVMSWIAPAAGGLAAVSNTASLANGKTWIGDAGGVAQEKFIGIADIRSTVAGNAQFFPTSCTAGQTLTWQSGTDTMICSNISLSASQVSGVVMNGGQAGAVTAGTDDATALTLETNNTARVTIDSTGKVGIGSASPSKALDINGGLTAYASTSTNSTSWAITNWLRSPKGTVSVFVGDNDSTAAYSATESSGNIRFNGSGNSWGDFGYYPTGGGDGNQGNFRFSMAGTAINSTPNAKVGVGELYSAGKVGIGTTTPARLLDVNGYVRVQDRIYSPSAYTGFFTDAGGALPVKVGSLAVTSSYSNSAPTNGLYVQGNVGIGTTTPAATLDVNGTLKVKSITTTVHNGGGGLPANTILFYVDPVSGSDTTGDGALATPYLTITKALQVFGTMPNSAVVIYITNSSDSNPALLGSVELPGKVVQFAGDAGSQVDVNGPISGALEVYLHNNHAQGAPTYRLKATTGVVQGVPKVVLGGHYGVTFRYDVNNATVINTIYTARYRSGGTNVYLGRTVLVHNTGITGGRLVMNQSNDPNFQVNAHIGLAQNVFNDIDVNSNVNWIYNSIKTNMAGNVGIGTETPGDKLHVVGKIRATHICYTDGTNCKDISTAWTGGGGTVTSITAGTGLTGGTITGSGTIGLGTELAGVAGLSTTGFVKRTGAGTYSTAAASLTADVSGVLPVANGGTNSTTALNNNRLMVSNGGAIVEAGAMTDGQIVVGKTGAAPQLVTMGGDATVSNTGAVVVTKIQGTAVSSTAPGTTGQVLRYDGSQWAPSMLSMFDLRSTVTGTQAFGGVGCLSNQTLTWTAATDNLSCTNISLPTSQLSGNVSLTTQVTGTLPIANGGTGVTSLPGTFVLNGGQAGAVTAGPSDANALTLQTGGSARMTILSSGNVGIGTTNPGNRFAVSSSSMATSGWASGISHYNWFGPSSASTADAVSTYLTTEATGANISGATATGSHSEILHTGTNTLGTAQAGVGKVRNTTTGTIGTATGFLGRVANESTGTITSARGIYADITNSGTVTNGYGVYIGSIGATTKWGLYQSDSSANNHFAGNVGIGTTNPNAKLHIQSASGAQTGFLMVNNDFALGSVGSGVTISTGAATGNTFTNLQAFILGNTAVGTLLLNGSGGNVGIGSTTPAGALDVASTTGAFVPPRMTEAQRDALVSPPDGSVIYNTTSTKMNFRENGAWKELGAGGGGGGPDVQTFTSSGTWTKPGSGTVTVVKCWGAGGSGGRNSSGAGGGGGGAYFERTFQTSTLPATVAVTVGVGGAGRTTNANGAAGGMSSFGSYLTAGGGGGGGQSGSGGGGGGGGGVLANGSSSTGVNGAAGGGSGTLGGGAGGGVVTNTGQPGGDGEYGGGAGGGSSWNGGGAGGMSIWGGGGGGGAHTTPGVGGTSLGGGAGGSGGDTGGTNGSVPGGGGGGTKTGTSGAGGDGLCLVTTT